MDVHISRRDLQFGHRGDSCIAYAYPFARSCLGKHYSAAKAANRQILHDSMIQSNYAGVPRFIREAVKHATRCSSHRSLCHVLRNTTHTAPTPRVIRAGRRCERVSLHRNRIRQRSRVNRRSTRHHQSWPSCRQTCNCSQSRC